MGRPSSEFWDLTYREIHACVEQYLDEREERLMLFGTGIATQINVATQGKKSLSWTDIFHSRKPRPPVDRLGEIRDRWRMAHAVNGTN